MDKQEIIQRISYFRTQANLSQKALSMDIDMNVCYINRLECKKDFLPSLEVLLKIIECCGLGEEEFFCDNYRNYKKEKEILSKIRGLTMDKQEALLKFLYVKSVFVTGSPFQKRFFNPI